MSRPLVERLCTICARGGSKGVPGKNIRDLVGKPLIAWTIEQARQSELFRLIAVSSDSDEILDVADRFGAEFLIKRPDDLATDHAGKIPAVVHAIHSSEAQARTRFDVVVDLQPTSPLRAPEDIVGALALLETEGRTSVITGAPASHSPYFNLVEVDGEGRVDVAKKPAKELVRRQDAPQTYDMNGSIYAWRRDEFLREPKLFYEDTGIYVMPPERSWDIDTQLDFKIADFLMRTRLDATAR